jgi:hypothetical protein
MGNMKQEDWDFVSQRLTSIVAGTEVSSDSISVRMDEATVVIEKTLKEVDDEHRLTAKVSVEETEDGAEVRQIYEYREKEDDRLLTESRYLKNKYEDDVTGKIVADARYCLRDAQFDLDQMNFRWSQLANQEVSEQVLRKIFGEL